MSIVAVVEPDGVVLEPVDGELVVAVADDVELLTGGSSPPPVHPAKPSSATKPHAAYR